MFIIFYVSYKQNIYEDEAFICSANSYNSNAWPHIWFMMMAGERLLVSKAVDFHLSFLNSYIRNF